MNRVIIPNLHVALIHFPLALLTTGLFIEIFSFLWRRSSVRPAARWMILLGAMALVPTATSGAAALVSVMGGGADQSDNWHDLRANSGLSASEMSTVTDHVLLGALASAIALIAAVGWLAGSDHWRKRTYLITLTLLISALVLALFGAWVGGEMVFRVGMGVEGRHSVFATGRQPQTAIEFIDSIVPKGQMHVILAGALFSLAAAAMGLSLRRAAVLREASVPAEPVSEAATYLATPAPVVADAFRVLPTNAELSATRVPSMPMPPPAVPSARFWVAALILGLGTVFSGLYFGDFLAWPGVANWDGLLDQIKRIPSSQEGRMGLHIVLGGTIVVLVLMMAILARFCPRNCNALGVVSLVLMLVLLAQFWAGIMMLFDGDQGPLTGFKSGDMPTPATMPSTEPAMTMPSTRAG